MLSKYSIQVSEFFGYCVKDISKGIGEGKDFENAISFLRDLRYDGVELPLMFDVDALAHRGKEILSSYGMEVSAITTGHYYYFKNYFLTSSDSAMRTKALDAAILGLSVCREFSSSLIIGSLRGKASETEKATIWLQNSLRILDKRAKDFGVKVLLEPINRYETNCINTIAEAYELIKSLGLNNTGIMIDSFHMNIEEKRFKEAIEDAKDLIWYVQLADSNRWPPSCGHIDFTEIITALKNIGYKGWFAIECLPKPSPKEAAKIAMNFLKKRIEW
jgi:sugar phosphate isomerase/epimerase